MENYKLFRSPQLTVYGRDSFKRVGSETALRGKRALLVSDGIMESLGYLDQCVRLFKRRKRRMCNVYRREFRTER